MVLAHEWLLSASGSDKTAAEIARSFDPVRDEVVVVTAAADPAIAEALFPGIEVRTLWTDRLPGVDRHWKHYAPALLGAWSTARMPEGDLLVSSSHFATKAAGAHFDGPHVTYCHSPLRFAWRPDLEDDRLGGLAGVVGRGLRPSLRRWDRWSADQVTAFVANSHSIAERIEQCYGRETTVIHPPVEVERFRHVRRSASPSHHLCFGRLVGYKRVDLAVEACTRAGLPLVVAGSGPELERLRSIAGPTVRFEPEVSDERYLELLADSISLLFPGEEDFGIVPVEVMAAGVPVVAYGRGGALDTVVDGVTGALFDEQTVESLSSAIERLSDLRADGMGADEMVRRFSSERFRDEFAALADRVVHEARRPVRAVVASA